MELHDGEDAPENIRENPAPERGAGAGVEPEESLWKGLRSLQELFLRDLKK